MSIEWLIVPFAAFFAAVISGLGGFGGALILVIILTPIVGVKAVIPLISVFATCNNLSRVFIYRKPVMRLILLKKKYLAHLMIMI